MSRRPKAATNAFTPSAAVAARRSMPVRWTIRRARACVSGQLHSAPPSHRSDKAGGVLRCIGWMRSPLCPRPRKGGQAKQRSLHAAAASPDALPPTRYNATDLDEDPQEGHFRHWRKPMASTVTAMPSTRMSEAEWQTRLDLAACYRLVDLFGWSDLVNTPITARVPGQHDHFLINPYGLLFDEVTASSLVKIDAEGNKVEPSPDSPPVEMIRSALESRGEMQDLPPAARELTRSRGFT